MENANGREKELENGAGFFLPPMQCASKLQTSRTQVRQVQRAPRLEQPVSLGMELGAPSPPRRQDQLLAWLG